MTDYTPPTAYRLTDPQLDDPPNEWASTTRSWHQLCTHLFDNTCELGARIATADDVLCNEPARRLAAAFAERHIINAATELEYALKHLHIAQRNQ